MPNVANGRRAIRAARTGLFGLALAVANVGANTTFASADLGPRPSPTTKLHAPPPHVGLHLALDSGAETPVAEGGAPEAGPVDPADAARRAKVALRVGERTVTVGELEDKLAEIPPFQARLLGATREEMIRAYLDQVLVRDLVLGAGAEQRGLDKKLPTVHQLARARSTATLRWLRSTLVAPGVISAEDVKKYYDDNRDHFDAPERVHLWRILVKTRDEAEALLAETKRDPQPSKWNEAARAKSLDKATNLRGGNLGFVAPDGKSNEAGLKVDPAIIQAARAVKDGELVPQVITEGEAYAVVWRRATVAATKRSLEDASGQIRTTLFRERSEAAEKQLIADLRKKHLKDFDPNPLKIVVLPPFDAGITVPRATPAPRDPQGGSSTPPASSSPR